MESTHVESVIDLALIPRRRVASPVLQTFLEPGYGAWALSTGDTDGVLAVLAGEGPHGEDVLEMSSQDTDVHFAKGDIVLPVLADTWIIEILVRVPSVGTPVPDITTNLASFYAAVYQGAAPDVTDYVAQHLGIGSVWKSQQWAPDEWRRVLFARETWPGQTEYANWDWDTHGDGIGFLWSTTSKELGKVQIAGIRLIDTSTALRRGMAVFFDNAYDTAYDKALKTLQNGIGCAVSISPEIVNQPNRMTLVQLKTLQSLGAEIWPTTKLRLNRMSRHERRAYLSRTKRWFLTQGFVEAADFFVWPIDARMSGVSPYAEPQITDDARDDVSRYFSAARGMWDTPAITTPPDPFVIPCLRVTNESTATLAGYRDYSQAAAGALQFFSFRNFWADSSAGDNYKSVDFDTFIEAATGKYTGKPSELIGR